MPLVSGVFLDACLHQMILTRATCRNDESLSGSEVKHAPSSSAHRAHLWPMLLDIALHLHLGPASNSGDASVAKTRVAQVMLVATSFLGFVYSLYVCTRVWHIEKRDPICTCKMCQGVVD